MNLGDTVEQRVSIVTRRGDQVHDRLLTPSYEVDTCTRVCVADELSRI